MPYCTALEVWDDLDLLQEASETFTSTASGDTVDLEHKYLVENAFTTAENSELSADQDVIVLDSNDNVQATSDYTVDLRDGKVTWNGTGTIDMTVRYKHAPAPNSRVQDKIADAEDRIDDITNTTFDGVESVSGEVYDGEGFNTTFYPLRGRPVDTVTSVEVNEAAPGDTDDWKTRTQGRDKDFTFDDVGIDFNTSSDAADNYKRAIKVDYDYGYSTVPAEVNKAARLIVIESLFEENVTGEGVDGRDDFNPQLGGDFKNNLEDILNRHRVERFDGPTTVH